jgi:tetratricopeptide (TPR) repeat protein
MHLGFALGARGRLDEAIGHHQQAVRLDPKSAAAHYNLGLTLRAKGRLDEAISHYQQALRIKPQWWALAHSNLDTCLYAAACAAARAAAEAGPEEAPLGEPQRARLRRQALERLGANLALRAQLRPGGPALGWSLTTWQTDPALACVRDRTPLARLPDAERKEWQCLWAEVAALLAADPLEQGRAHAAGRDWARAAGSYARALQRHPTEGDVWFEYAAVLLLSGDRAGYLRACARMVQRCGKAPKLRAYHVARACTLAPDVALVARAGRLAQKELQASAGTFSALTERGALHYRAGRFKEAVPLFERSLRAEAKPGHAVLNWLWLALAQARLGQPEEARRWLSKAVRWLDGHGGGLPAGPEDALGRHLHNGLEAQVLRREAEALLKAGKSRLGRCRGRWGERMRE